MEKKLKIQVGRKENKLYKNEDQFVRGQKTKIAITLLLLLVAIGIDEWDIVFFFPVGCLISAVLGILAYSCAWLGTNLFKMIR